MTIKEEFKLVKKVLRKHGFLRAYRRMIRKEFNRTLLEDVRAWRKLNKDYEILCLQCCIKGYDFWSNVDEDLYNQQLRYTKQK